jgi:hypothetical protein
VLESDTNKFTTIYLHFTFGVKIYKDVMPFRGENVMAQFVEALRYKGKVAGSIPVLPL